VHDILLRLTLESPVSGRLQVWREEAAATGMRVLLCLQRPVGWESR
jgi:hypothetical protein